ncbi:DUF1653 domain-containing protein [Eubacterium oxidoreducens]|uniref:DUF1653 domain-containing protein n=1 Tax=Eubacterium oxidoreducens TaxID=1732 RepID=A0A1G6ABP0_EUBOX|nr:DUF1653 domain-containing protein [Eubacterium oxidoreducens]SDB05818.1 Protein of unknown function [Eubacterium oxidoreducens]
MRTVHSGELFRHFKNKMYQIVAVAEHSETGEELVIYQALYGDYRVYARPKEMFLSEVDHEKYPQVTQKYRFEKVDRNSMIADEEKKENLKTATQMDEMHSQEEAGEQANPLLLRFLDAQDTNQQIQVLKEIKNELTDRLINDIAVVLDVVIEEGPIEERYKQLSVCLDTKNRFETGRFGR